MELTLDQLNKDKVQLNADILKIIVAFQAKYSIGINHVELIEARTIAEKFGKVVGINVEVRL